MIESFDVEVYAVGHLVSGHTLKHLAGSGVYFIALMLTSRTAETYEDTYDSSNSTIISSKEDCTDLESSKMANGVFYDRSPVVAPRLRGMALRALVALMEAPLTGALIKPLLRRGLGVKRLREFAGDDPPTYLPLHHCKTGHLAPPTSIEHVPTLTARGPGFHYRSIRDFEYVYKNGLVTPEQVAERVLAAVSDSEKPPKLMHLFIACDRDDVISQAREATRRHAQGRACGRLDGVPIAVKDEVDMVPYPTTAGTAFLGRQAAQRDSTVVARLRSAGALLIGKTNMHEIGILPDGVNPHYGTVRNPHNLNHESGGSSSGSAAAVAAGLCPVAIGADGGGSIRIPSTFCGVVGLKPTFGRVSEVGAVPLNWSVAHLGPIGATAEETALVYAAISGQDPEDPNTHLQPPAQVTGFGDSLKGVRIGIYWDWFNDADAQVVAPCKRMLQEFERMGAALVELVIPDLPLIALAHGVTIHSEMAASMDCYDRHHRRDFGLRTRLMLANIRALRSSDYVQAQRIRTLAIRHFLVALNRADVVATPATAITAPLIAEGSLPEGESDMSEVMKVMLFANPGNLTGLPAISVPAGYDQRGLPVGLQLMASPWDEDVLFRLAYSAEGIVERRRPSAFFDLLSELGES